MKDIGIGLLIGLVVGILDVVIFKFVFGIPVSDLDALGAIAFWTATGMLVHTSSIPFHPILKGLFIACAIGIAWLVDAVNGGRSGQILFLIGIFVFYGALTGLFSGLVKRKLSRS